MSYSISRVQWEQAAPLLKTVREQVFICERRIPKRIEFDCKDRYAHHILVCSDISQEAVATGRILASGEIGRIAVLKAHRKDQLDKIILIKLFTIAKELKLREIFIYSPLYTTNYFSQYNFIRKGSVFMEAGIPKQKMTCEIHKVSFAKYYLSH